MEVIIDKLETTEENSSILTSELNRISDELEKILSKELLLKGVIKDFDTILFIMLSIAVSNIRDEDIEKVKDLLEEDIEKVKDLLEMVK